MIKGIYSGNGITVSGITSPPYINMSNPSSGMMRYNGNTQSVEVYDGMSWFSMSSAPQVELDHRVREIVTWAEKKMLEERELMSRIEKHPGLRDAYEKFKIMDALTLEEKNNDHGEVQASP